MSGYTPGRCGGEALRFSRRYLAQEPPQCASLNTRIASDQDPPPPVSAFSASFPSRLLLSPSLSSCFFQFLWLGIAQHQHQPLTLWRPLETIHILRRIRQLLRLATLAVKQPDLRLSFASHPRWSPDGNYLAFLSVRNDAAPPYVLHLRLKKYSFTCIFLLHAESDLVFFNCELVKILATSIMSALRRTTVQIEQHIGSRQLSFPCHLCS